MTPVILTNKLPSFCATLIILTHSKMVHHHLVILPLLWPYYHPIVEWVAKADCTSCLKVPPPSSPKNYLFFVLQDKKERFFSFEMGFWAKKVFLCRPGIKFYGNVTVAKNLYQTCVPKCPAINPSPCDQFELNVFFTWNPELSIIKQKINKAAKFCSLWLAIPQPIFGLWNPDLFWKLCVHPTKYSGGVK